MGPCRFLFDFQLWPKSAKAEKVPLWKKLLEQKGNRIAFMIWNATLKENNWEIFFERIGNKIAFTIWKIKSDSVCSILKKGTYIFM